jgi:hypothetical protein
MIWQPLIQDWQVKPLIGIQRNTPRVVVPKYLGSAKRDTLLKVSFIVELYEVILVRFVPGEEF